MAPVGEDGAGGAGADTQAGVEDDEGKLGAGGSSYVPPHLRNGGKKTGESMGGGKYERDDLATLRVTNVSLFRSPPTVLLSRVAGSALSTDMFAVNTLLWSY